MDRQTIVQSLIEGALRAAADPSVTTVLRDWDYYKPGTSAQPLAPFLVVGMTDDTPYGVGIGLYRSTVQVMIVAAKTPAVRQTFDAIRPSVRSVMESVAHLAAAGVSISRALEIGCTQPDHLNESGDIMLAQVLTFRVWFEAPEPPPAILDPVIYLCDRDPETGVTYTTTQAADPRRIDRWTPSPTGITLAQGYGVWADRATLAYTAPVQPLSTEIPLPVDPADQTVTP